MSNLDIYCLICYDLSIEPKTRITTLISNKNFTALAKNMLDEYLYAEWWVQTSKFQINALIFMCFNSHLMHSPHVQEDKVNVSWHTLNPPPTWQGRPSSNRKKNHIWFTIIFPYRNSSFLLKWPRIQAFFTLIQLWYYKKHIA